MEYDIWLEEEIWRYSFTQGQKKSQKESSQRQFCGCQTCELLWQMHLVCPKQADSNEFHHRQVRCAAFHALIRPDYGFCHEDRERSWFRLWQPQSWVTMLVMLGEVTRSWVGQHILVRIWQERDLKWTFLKGLATGIDSLLSKAYWGRMGLQEIFINMGGWNSREVSGPLWKGRGGMRFYISYFTEYGWKNSVNHTPGRALFILLVFVMIRNAFCGCFCGFNGFCGI